MLESFFVILIDGVLFIGIFLRIGVGEICEKLNDFVVVIKFLLMIVLNFLMCVDFWFLLMFVVKLKEVNVIVFL